MKPKKKTKAKKTLTNLNHTIEYTANGLFVSSLISWKPEQVSEREKEKTKCDAIQIMPEFKQLN